MSDRNADIHFMLDIAGYEVIVDQDGPDQITASFCINCARVEEGSEPISREQADSLDSECVGCSLRLLHVASACNPTDCPDCLELAV